MRAQMHELKQDINRHNMINEKLMRQVMAYKSARIRQYKSFELFVFCRLSTYPSS